MTTIPTGGQNGSSGEGGGGPAGPAPRRDEDILAFFILDSAKAFRELRDVSERLASLAERVAKHVDAAGVDASAEVLREFHLASRQHARAGWLTGQLVACLDLEHGR